MMLFQLSFAQPTEMLNPDLLANSHNLKVVYKNFSSRPEFGPYAMTKRKRKWSKDVSDSRLFEYLDDVRGWEKWHFFFQRAEGLALVVNHGKVDSMVHKERVVTPYFEIGSDGIGPGARWHKVTVWNESIFASMMAKGDTTEWAMAVFNFSQDYDDGSSSDMSEGGWRIRVSGSPDLHYDPEELQLLGYLTNGDLFFEITEGGYIEDTGKLIPKIVTWYEFYQNGEPVAAVVREGITVNKIHTRFRKGMDKEVETYLAAAIATLLYYDAW